MQETPSSSSEEISFAAEKAAILAILRPLAIATVVISYDGYADSGQIEDIVALDASGAVLNLRSLRTPSDSGLSDALDEFAWTIITHYHAHFEDNEGGFGDFTIDVAAGTILLEHQQRFTEYHYIATEL
jgi:hypothetical protein